MTVFRAENTSRLLEYNFNCILVQGKLEIQIRILSDFLRDAKSTQHVNKVKLCEFVNKIDKSKQCEQNLR